MAAVTFMRPNDVCLELPADLLFVGSLEWAESAA